MSKLFFQPHVAAGDLISEHNIQRLSTGNRRQLLSYNQNTGLYVLDDNPIEVAAQNLFLANYGDAVKNRDINEMMCSVKRNADPIKPDTINAPSKKIIIFKNGALIVSGL